jgi:Protein of unknown function (DUF3107)
MEVRIGVIHTAKELTFETDAEPDTIVKSLEDAIAKGVSLLWLEDGKGRKVGIPADKVGYVELVVDDGTRKVGFGR